MPDIDLVDSITSIDYGDLAVLTASALGDPGYSTWTLAQLKEWILEAIKDFSIHFRRVASTIVTCASGTRQYALPNDTWAVIRVEHPTGNDPPTYLVRFDHNRADFTTAADRYDYTITGTQTDAKIWISRTPALGEYIDVLYSGYWWSPNGSSYTIRCAETHYPLLIQYAMWRAYHERWSHALLDNLTIQYTPEAGKTAYTYATDRAARWYEAAELARRTYDKSITTAKAQLGKSDTARWQMGDVDVIY